jgi:hypothetical protein
VSDAGEQRSDRREAARFEQLLVGSTLLGDVPIREQDGLNLTLSEQIGRGRV